MKNKVGQAFRPAFFVLFAALALTAQPRIVNARLEQRSAAAGLEKEFRALTGNQVEPAWLGYTVPMVAGRDQGSCCGSAVCGACRLEWNRDLNTDGNSCGTLQLEGPAHLLVLFRVEQRNVGRIRTFSGDCPIDAGGLPFYWLAGVRPEESIALLSSFVSSSEEKKMQDSPLSAIALHASPAADQALERFVAVSQPESLRGRAAFWLGVARGKRGYEVLRRMVQEDPSDHVRERAVFALSQSKETQAVETIIAVARNDKSPHVRGQALFWLAQKAGKKAAGAITDAIENDPETEVKRRAVFALSQLPKEDGIPLLIQVARTNRNPEVRKQAMFWLGQSKDSRALAFFEEVLAR